MYLINLTGIRNPIEVTTAKGDVIKDKISQNAMSDEFIEVNNRMFRISAVKSIEYTSDNRAEREPEPVFIPLTPEERTKRDEIIADTRKQLEERGVFKDKERTYAPGVIWYKNCVECGQPLPKGMARVCSGVCYQKQPA